MHILAQMGGPMQQPDEPSLDSIERNRRWNRDERRKVARRLMDETIETIVSVMEFHHQPIREELQTDLDAIEAIAALLNQYGEEKICRWVKVLAREKIHSNERL